MRSTISKISKVNFGKINSKTFYRYLKNSLGNDTFYISVGYIPDNELLDYAGSLDSDVTYVGGIDSDYDEKDAIFYSQHTMSQHKVYPGAVSVVAKRINWTYNNNYDAWPNANSYVLVKNIENGFTRLNVYLCLFSPNKQSLNAPNNVTAESFILNDGYVWKYLYTISQTEAIKFLDKDWIPVPTAITAKEAKDISVGSNKYNQYLVQTTAETGRVFGITINDQTALAIELSNLGYSMTDTVGVIAIDRSGNIPSQTLKAQITYDTDLSKYIVSLIERGEGYVGPVKIHIDSDTVLENVSSYVAPLSGFGSDPINELNATNVKVTVREINEDYNYAFVNNTPFNLISLVTNPIDANSKQIAQGDYYTGCRSFTTVNINQFTVGEIISTTIADTNRLYYVVGIYGDKVYYLNTQQDKEYYTLKNGDTITNIPSTKTNTIARHFDREIFFNSGNILASKYLDETIYRTKDQIESFNFIINFE